MTPVAFGAPDYELTRSPAAARVGRLARASNLFLANFEHRVELSLPEHWLPGGRVDLGVPPEWQGAQLPESKYHSFRHERRICGFHPGQRSKWTAHELCHAAIGFAWAPDATTLFHAVAARVAEALPVALWYFLDEDGLRRCPDHRGQGALFEAYCPRCEAAHREGPDDTACDERWAEQGLAFVERELSAAQRSLAAGRMFPNRYATIDLGTDGLAYAAANAARLRSPAFREYVAAFFPAGTGYHATLDSLVERVRAVARDLTGGPEAEALVGTRAQWMAQDVAWRLIQVREDTSGEAEDVLAACVERLADAPTDESLASVIADYTALEAEYDLPSPADVFAVGYLLPGGLGRSVRQVEAGLRSGLPATAALLGHALTDITTRFVAADEPLREPLGRRFARWAKTAPDAALPDGAAELIDYEAALAHAPAPDLEALTLADDVQGGALRLSDGAAISRAQWDVMGYAASVDAGQAPVRVQRPSSAVVTRAANGDVLVVPLSEAVADQLERLPGELPRSAEVDELLTLGALTRAF